MRIAIRAIIPSIAAHVTKNITILSSFVKSPDDYRTPVLHCPTAVVLVSDGKLPISCATP